MMRAAAFRLLPAARSRAHDSAAAVATSWRLALAVFVVVLAPAEAASGVFTDRAGLKAAVDDLSVAEATHGPIAGWDVSRVDDMSDLFCQMSTFNAAIGAWDTSSVTTMESTFQVARAFNQQLDWDTSKGEEGEFHVLERRGLQPAARLGCERGDDDVPHVPRRSGLQPARHRRLGRGQSGGFR